MTVLFDARSSCDACPIRHRAVCSTCDDSELGKLEKIKTYKSFKAGDPIAWRGDTLGFVASVVQGVATLSKTLEDGRTQMVGLLLASDFLGRPGRRNVEFDVTAVTDLTLCCFDQRGFEGLVSTTPHLSDRLIEIAMDELDAARDWMLLLGRKTAREKIATFITMLVRRQSVDGPATELALPLTRDEIANYLGLTLETVSRQLTAMKNDGILRFTGRRQFDVLDMAGLIAASGDDDGADWTAALGTAV